MVGRLREDSYHGQPYKAACHYGRLVLCVKGAVSLWIIFFSIVRLLVPYKVLSSIVLGCLGLCLDE
jgi:hypothetical protein